MASSPSYDGETPSLPKDACPTPLCFTEPFNVGFFLRLTQPTPTVVMATAIKRRFQFVTSLIPLHRP
ncbi:hypothetical protein AGMMS49543_13830 [Betaproteobacteria bacterium]|nr:hypothetical protein AGMMS49543_13830 [Betaproteobacteria bacterium]